MKKIKRNFGVPRHKRIKRESRLLLAKAWVTEYAGKNLIKGYSKHFAVDKLCAVKELTLLGYKIEEEYVTQLKQSLEAQKKLIEKRKKLREDRLSGSIYDDYEYMFWEYEDYVQGDSIF
ncbi:hypothetical protein B0P06_003855 [Clostridium saccharoperbutylacetonicum]|uniref:Uncharacterized protein n=1 Tax=Clostridium saccharoperbutylacetonicum N1-4(HMT) TaxID=931276 RepID=M1MSZ5_9CLOT|nr:hypothetical protein [Clostridium saccharoperbutylacetonicum]AGF57836.1 hypothetical protein Cspa_c40830 [Clostridium saccharoperbutylacetonicum N1-4(HMT)]NRT61392.1 hypothetical protein [Clostridium saccharoperbutylacetonicum]NSB24710.1 hypothetical protein [Clostridium saccharoperbutylacetonicum]NSB44084.1 hypothetical protein [Clostridium saccharoperbutylacetonicum]